MLDLIRTAYGLDGDKILGGPAWLDYDRFDVIGQNPFASAVHLDTLKSMLQALLAARFKLTLHKDNQARCRLCPFDGQGQTETEGGGRHRRNRV